MFLLNVYKKTQAYRFLIILLTAIFLGAVTGYILGPKALKLKPLGDIFLNLMFTLVVPLVFFSVASAIASMNELKRLGKILGHMLGSFLFTGIIAAIFMLAIVKLFPPGQGVYLPLTMPPDSTQVSLAEQIVNIFTVSDFIKLFSRDNMLALIFFAILVGVATIKAGEKARLVANFLEAGTEVSMKAVAIIMYYAPIGFFAYFAVLVGELGPKIIHTYLHATVIYYLAAALYFGIFFSLYAYLAGKKTGIRLFWKQVPLPALTALATCSSAASIPANLQATQEMGIPKEVYELVVPVGAITHKDGSVLGGIIKIAFLFGIFHMDFSGSSVLLMALVIGILVGTVMGAIPSGGMIGEMLILTVYGFPPQALIIIAAISMIIDPPATMLNVTCNTVTSMLVTRLVEGRNWFREARLAKIP